jgi:EF hand
MKLKSTAITALAMICLATGAATARNNGTVAPPSAGPYGPMSSADHNKDGTVTHAEWEDFMSDGAYRRYGFVQYFDMLDTNGDGNLTATERHRSDPPNVYDDVDFNGDGLVSRAEAERQVAGRAYREMPGEDFFALLDTNGNDQISPAEMQAAQNKGLLPNG